MRGLDAVAACAAVTLVAAPGTAYATGGGTNLGAAGFVYETVTVGGVTFTGTCEYRAGSFIAGEATAAGPVVTTGMQCRVKHGTSDSSVSKSSPGLATWVGTDGAVAPGTGVCISMSAVRLDGGTAWTGEHCV